MRSVIIILILFSSIPVFSQQEPLTSMFWNNYSVVNPANSGFDYRHFATVQGRNQWVNYEGNPKTAWVNYDIKIDGINSGSGIHYMYDELGNMSSNAIFINFNYQLSFLENHRLGVGISFGYQEQHFTDKWVAYHHPSIDPAIPKSTSSTCNASVGLKYNFKNLTAGFSIRNLSEPAYSHEGTHWEIEYPNYRTYYFLSTYTIKLSESFELEPGAFFRYDIVAESLDINLRSTYKEKLWFGSSIRGDSESFSAITAMAGVILWKELQLGLSADVEIDRHRNYGVNSYELFISYGIE